MNDNAERGARAMDKNNWGWLRFASRTRMKRPVFQHTVARIGHAIFDMRVKPPG